jgi:hypothetical protein
MPKPTVIEGSPGQFAASPMFVSPRNKEELRKRRLLDLLIRRKMAPIDALTR